jgi:hypothetical protein
MYIGTEDLRFRTGTLSRPTWHSVKARRSQRAAQLTGHVFGSCWVCQRMRTHSDRVITVGLVRSVISTLGSWPLD